MINQNAPVRIASISLIHPVQLVSGDATTRIVADKHAALTFDRDQRFIRVELMGMCKLIPLSNICEINLT